MNKVGRIKEVDVVKKIIRGLIYTLCISAAATPDSSAFLWDATYWDLPALCHPKNCEAVVMGNLVQITIPSKGDERYDFYLIIPNEILYGSLKSCSVLAVSKDQITNRNPAQEKMVFEAYRNAGREIREGRWERNFTMDPYLLFLTAHQRNLIASNDATYLYGLVGGVDGIVAMSENGCEKRSRTKIQNRYGIDMSKYAVVPPLDYEDIFNDKYPEMHSFIESVKYFLKTHNYSDNRVNTDDLKLSNKAKSIYDTLVRRKPFPDAGEGSADEFIIKGGQ